MALFSFKTLSGPTEGIYREKGSKFLAFAFPVADEASAREKLAGLKKKYFEASHHCFAYVLGPDKDKTRAHDDGEPGHSAGDPILGQIRSLDLTNVLVVVVRYFGGTKLGVGGLVNAYKAAAADALSRAELIEEDVLTCFSLDYDYAATPDVMRMVKEFDLGVRQQRFEDRGTLEVACKLKEREKFLERIKLLKALRVDLTWEEKSPS